LRKRGANLASLSKRPSASTLAKSNGGSAVKRLRDALWEVSTRKGPCWCPDDRLVDTEGHETFCVDARKAWDETAGTV
jgi:hypothetical protein